MKRNIYYQVIYQRPNFLWDWFLGFFYQASSWPRLLLEVFIRRNMGERYFSFFGVVGIFLLLVARLLYKLVLAKRLSFYSHESDTVLYSNALSLGLFTAAFLYFGIERRGEINRLPSVFDFQRFSLSTGNSVLRDPTFPLRLPTWFTANPRRLATLTEPGLFFLAGLLLFGAMQSVGSILMVCSVIYSLSYLATYRMGDNLVMDHIDNIIASEEMDAAFNQGLPASQTRGFDPHCRRPADPNFRRKVVDSFLDDDDDEEPVLVL